MSLLEEITAKLANMDAKSKAALAAEVDKSSVGALKWVPNSGPQTAAYFCKADELFYGGEAGGGKSDLLVGLSLNEHTVSRIFRKQHGDRAALIDRFEAVLGTRDGYNGSDHTWRIPGGERTVRFGAMNKPDAWKRYQGDPTDFKGWDEVTHFTREEYTTVNAWLRSTKEGQRCRIVAAGNPPVDADGMWVIDYWGPWLDPEYADPLGKGPAREGELRWFTTIGDDDSVEVEEEWEGIDHNGLVIKPRSRTFIRAGLADNPDLKDSGYASTLMALPKYLRDALALGQFRASLEDQDRQVIPSEWILQAQQRWLVRQKELQTKPMTALGVDVAQGGADRMVCVPLHGTVFGEPVIKKGKEVATPALGAAMILTIARDDPQINVDGGGGYGGGIVEHLKSNEFNVLSIKGGSGSKAKDRDGERSFENKRVELIWRFREALDPERGDSVCLPPGRQILRELSAFQEKPHADARKVIKIESNDDIKDRLKMSPDLAWGFFFAWAEPDEAAKRLRKTVVSQRNARAKRAPRSVNRQYGKVTGRQT